LVGLLRTLENNMPNIPIALQLYSVREDCAKDLPCVLKSVAAMGYTGVEFAGYHGRTAQELRMMLDDFGLQCAGTHTAFDTLLPERVSETVEFNRILGNKYLIAPSLPESHRNSKAAWLETAALFNEAAAAVKPHGMVVGYHNHHVEFQPMDGELPWDTFFGNTTEDVVMQLDTGNALHGGADPVPFLQRYPGRALTVHLKEYSATDDTVLIGDGDVRWEEVFSLCENYGGTEWYIVEQESYAFPPLDCVNICLQRLREMGK
jgi:sugar phosphate isomerase/epimerase